MKLLVIFGIKIYRKSPSYLTSSSTIQPLDGTAARLLEIIVTWVLCRGCLICCRLAACMDVYVCLSQFVSVLCVSV